MTVLKQAFIELILLTLASVGVAVGANEVRERGYIQLTKNYFDKGRGAPPKSDGASNKSIDVSHAETVNAPKRATGETAAAKKKHLEHDFQTITVDEAHEVLDDPKTEQGLNVFVDARDEEHFAEGHIPGAIQCFPYESDKCLNRVVTAAGGAEKVIVYCGGGDCEDSIFMCRELQEAGVPYDALYLFEGGWKEWSAKGLHTETGSQ